MSTLINSVLKLFSGSTIIENTLKKVSDKFLGSKESEDLDSVKSFIYRQTEINRNLENRLNNIEQALFLTNKRMNNAIIISLFAILTSIITIILFFIF